MAKRKTKKRPSPRFVLDCSVTMAWYFKDEADPYAKAVRHALERVEAVVPVLWPLEVANILILGERRRRSSEADANKWLSYLRHLPIRIDAETPVHAWVEILQLARNHEASAYDAAYLELALRLGLPMATLDDKLRSVCAAAGVMKFQP